MSTSQYKIAMKVHKSSVTDQICPNSAGIENATYSQQRVCVTKPYCCTLLQFVHIQRALNPLPTVILWALDANVYRTNIWPAASTKTLTMGDKLRFSDWGLGRPWARGQVLCCRTFTVYASSITVLKTPSGIKSLGLLQNNENWAGLGNCKIL